MDVLYDLVQALPAEQKSDRSYYSKSSSSVRNYLFYNQTDSTSHWLLESNNWLILNKHTIHAGINKEKKYVVGFLYEIVKRDTNNNGRLDYDDIKSVYYSRFES